MAALYSSELSADSIHVGCRRYIQGLLSMNYWLSLLSAISERNAAIHDKCVAGNSQSSF